jgi:nucleoside-diphosphate-sugar epimerase
MSNRFELIDFINKFIPNADVIHHLAGITNVAYVKSDQNLERDNLIKSTAIQGTNNILKLMKTNAKIIFPSTHVVFDGLNKTEKLITVQQTPPTINEVDSSCCCCIPKINPFSKLKKKLTLYINTEI